MKKKEIDLSLVIPIYNEAENLRELIRRCLLVCRQLNRSFEIILVNDGSRDDSARLIADATKTAGNNITGIFLNRNYGQHAAVIAGMTRSRGNIVITLDADLQNPPEEIPKLLREIEKGFDVVGTIRTNRCDSLFRKFFSGIVNSAVRRATGVMMHDYGCMLRGYRRPVIEAILQCRERSTFIPILANSFAGSTSEISVQHQPRKNGESKYSIFKLISLQFDLLTSMSTFPLRLLSFLGTVIALSGMTFGAFLMVMRFLMGAAWAAHGVFTLFAVLFVFIGAQFIGLGLLGEYIGRIYQDVRARPRYHIQSILTEQQQDNPPVSNKPDRILSEYPVNTEKKSYENCYTCLS
ncbi:undecaprenyl-phosphate 4-deoxy-4-formamido-L-arabinose transferase [Desulfomarina profundi]|uniref:Undecaprenyl-phosphate 4-deoxy-4-formamido-L-arabinose transferase n=1 Tax=Desulfomarina profundi TaxID=2772557 RepID=A0A8D5FMC7_9BACT|nr:glycosyltransferase [Desulfomarina profundi]BCL61703.1 undecaprenyl-phosphate 4-deoxy-4-formamido-L-arabinose transferase [Desulfomarina profundi]